MEAGATFSLCNEKRSSMEIEISQFLHCLRYNVNGKNQKVEVLKNLSATGISEDNPMPLS